jgi:hypothetical protein
MSFCMFVLWFAQEYRLVYKITCKCDSCYAESRKGPFESIPPCKGSGIPPSFSVGCLCQRVKLQGRAGPKYALAQGSLALHTLLVDASVNCFMSNPVGLDCGAMSMRSGEIRTSRSRKQGPQLVGVGRLVSHKYTGFLCRL